MLHLRGDDVGSDRLQNALTGLSIPVVIQPEDVPLADVTTWLPFHFAIPWDDILVVVPQDEFAADPGGAIMRHTNLAEAEIEHRRRLDRLIDSSGGICQTFSMTCRLPALPRTPFGPHLLPNAKEVGAAAGSEDKHGDSEMISLVVVALLMS